MDSANHWELRNYITDALITDVIDNEDRLKETDSNLNKRNYVRSLFAVYEAVLANIRDGIATRILQKSQQQGTFEFHEFIVLLDDTARINEKGEIKKESNKIPFLNLIKYCIKKYCELIGLNRNFLSEKGFDFFRKSVEIRHRITHPHYLKEIDISDDEIKMVNNGRDWWNNTINEIHNHIIKNNE